LEPWLLDFIGILLCLCGSAFFSGSETALTSLSQPQIQKLIDEEGASALELWRDRPIQVLTAILIGNNIFNITASALATELAQTLLDDNSFAIPVAVGAMTFALLTFGEITPKSVAKQWAKKLSPTIMWLMQFPFLLFKPATLIFTAMTRRLMRWIGDETEEHFATQTAEEIEYLVDLGARQGSFSEDRERLLRSVFEFPDTIVREVMVPRTEMVTVSVDMDLQTIVDELTACGHSRIPVRGDNLDDIRGLFYAKDLINLAKINDVDEFDIEKYLRDPYFVPEQKGIAELLSEFQAEHMHMAIVVDEFGGTAGLITLEDIIEEFFGDIQDEYDTEDPPRIERIGEDTYHVDARMPVDEIESFCDLELPDHPDYDSLGGFLMAQSGSVPEAGSEVPWEHVVFRVLEADPKSVQTVEIEQVREPTPDVDEAGDTDVGLGEGSSAVVSEPDDEATDADVDASDEEDEDPEDDSPPTVQEVV
jgi:CBS domain containing-hemolysin-like protein